MIAVGSAGKRLSTCSVCGGSASELVDKTEVVIAHRPRNCRSPIWVYQPVSDYPSTLAYNFKAWYAQHLSL